jgi:HK97 family phage prohead protease
MSKYQREVRVFAALQKITIRKNAEDGTRSASGYFATFGTLSHDLGFREVLTRGCFADSLRTQAVQCLFNHDNGKLLGRTESGTLSVREDAKGLRFDVKLPDTSYANDLIALMERGDAYECSFGFSVPDGGDDWSQMPNGELLRTINTAILYEGSILVSPAAYPKTSANVRSCPDGLACSLPVTLDPRGKRAKRDDDDCDPETDDDCEDEDRCECACASCVNGDCLRCADTRCERDECMSCPAQQRAAHLDLLLRRL